MTRNSLFAEHARLLDGWRRDVLLEWDDKGTLLAVTPDSTQPAGVNKAKGPVLAGMPNLHSHAFQRAMAGLTEYRANPTDSFWSWRDLMYRFAARISPDSIGDIARWLYIEMLKAGYTSVCEFHYVHHAPNGQHYANPAEMAARVVNAATQTGIGMTMLPVLYQYSGFGEREPTPGQARFIHTPESLLDALVSLRKAQPENGNLRYGVAPHSLRAVSKQTLGRMLSGLDREFPGAPVHIHIAEQTAEVDACLETLKARPVRWLLDNFDVNERWCLVHATHIDENEMGAMAASRAIAGLCLTTEANLGDGIFPTHGYLADGGRFGLGSDSHIAVDWRSELRLLEYGQRLMRRERNVLASNEQVHVADRLFDAAVLGGASASGRAVGVLEAGRRADFIVLDADHPAIAGHAPDAWLSGVVFGEHGETPVLDVSVGGKVVVEARRHRDEGEAFGQYRKTLAGLLE
ncbi:N-formimino-L-glutamate deiminase [Caballeronia mineralivorans PML1(12)]|uniref:N-formimino-L-glutamate deiminase n=1 Tax=Caballeronia mineralivorans PML1(12) TaxID=908627 RepID=A0A0J1FRT2_9BURK|nr:formimidoylglutamate deiminase [Caballeronia mineralivorans]KLU22468.1 N-formimino-L-glutamate deiminase [Caballeronia mineralivorans PML1(12)]